MHWLHFGRLHGVAFESGYTIKIDIALSLVGSEHPILLQNQPIFTKHQENTYNEGKQICNSSLNYFFGTSIFEPLYLYYAH